MLAPTMVAASGSHLRLYDRAWSEHVVAWTTPASQGGRVNPTIGCSRKMVVAGKGAPCVYS
ncbi:hypothetical protein ABIF97_000461 [Bradyrhizobium japonicum]